MFQPDYLGEITGVKCFEHFKKFRNLDYSYMQLFLHDWYICTISCRYREICFPVPNAYAYSMYDEPYLPPRHLFYHVAHFTDLRTISMLEFWLS